MVPCALCDMQFRVALPEQDEIQVTVVGMALGLGEPLRTDRYKKKVVCRSLSKDQVRKSGKFLKAIPLTLIFPPEVTLRNLLSRFTSVSTV